MRCVQSSTYSYIWNAWSDGITEYAAENMQGRSWPAMLATINDESVAARVEHYLRRVPEELYDSQQDPDGLINLAGLAEYGPDVERMRGLLLRWMSDTKDHLMPRFRDMAVLSL